MSRRRLTGVARNAVIAFARMRQESLDQLRRLQPPSEQRDQRGRKVVVLTSLRGVEAAFRRRSDGTLKQLRPSELKEVVE